MKSTYVQRTRRWSWQEIITQPRGQPYNIAGMCTVRLSYLIRPAGWVGAYDVMDV